MHSNTVTNWLIGLTLLLPFGGMALLARQEGTLRADNTPLTVGYYGVAFATFVLALIIAEKRPGLLTLRTIWIVAVLARTLLIFTTPTLSDDVYRYLWDGHVAINGVSPYALPIDSAELNPLDHPIRSLANNTWMASPYLPAAQWVFAWLGWMVGPNPLSMQIVMVIFELGAAVFIAKLLAAANFPSHRILLWLWNPLVIVEVAHSAHVDAWMIFLMLASIWFAFIQPSVGAKGVGNQPTESENELRPTPYARNLEINEPPRDVSGRSQDNFAQSRSVPTFFTSTKGWISVILMALATLTKILPVLILPVLFWRWTWWQRIGYGLLTVSLLIPAGLRAGWGLIGPLDGTGLFGALRIYNDRWKFNSGLFFWFTRFLNDGDGYTPSIYDSTVKIGVGVTMVIVLLVVWIIAYKYRGPRSALRLMAVPMIAYLLLTHTVHPWYALILLIFLPFLPPAKDEHNNRWLIAAPWIYLSGTLIFSYLTYLDPNDFRELAWVRNLEWIPTLTLLAIGVAVFVGNRFTREPNSLSI